VEEVADQTRNPRENFRNRCMEPKTHWIVQGSLHYTRVSS
jgi:hypothetical protein